MFCIVLLGTRYLLLSNGYADFEALVLGLMFAISGLLLDVLGTVEAYVNDIHKLYNSGIPGETKYKDHSDQL